MLPVHRTQISVFNYDEIPVGYYHRVMREGHPIQQFWHQKKFLSIVNRISQGSRVLDLGCSAGSFLDMMAENRSDLLGLGVDIASQQIEFAKKNIEPKYGGRIKFQKIETGKLGQIILQEKFDVVTSIEVVEHIHPHLAMRMLMDAKASLKENGKLIMTTPNYRSFWPLIEWGLEKTSPVKYHDQHINKYTPNSFAKFIESAGFRIENISTIFTIAPFASGISWSLAEKLHHIEMKSRLLTGSLLVIEAVVDESLI